MTTCQHCDHPIRPHRALAADYPGTRQGGGRGLCVNCSSRPEIRDRYEALAVARFCEVEGCDRRHSARGFCAMHWKRMLRTGTTDAPKPRARKASAHTAQPEKRHCVECHTPTRRKSESANDHPGTTREEARGLCAACYQLMEVRNRRQLPGDPPVQGCSEEDCGRVAMSRGMCRAHAQQRDAVQPARNDPGLARFLAARHARQRAAAAREARLSRPMPRRAA